MANSRFVVFNAAHNNVLLVSILSVLFVAVYTDGQSKVGIHFLSCLLVNTVLNRLLILLVLRSQTFSSYARLFVNSVLCINGCKTIH